MPEILIMLLLAGLIAPPLVNRMGPKAFLVLALFPAGGAVWVATRLPQVLKADPLAANQGGHAPPSFEFDWIPQLGVGIDFRMDALSAVLALLVLGVGALVLAYCAKYFNGDEDGLPGFAGSLTAFTGAMFGLVLAEDVIVMFVFWEFTTILSYLLIGFTRADAKARFSALQALIVTTAGGLALLVGLIGLSVATGSTHFTDIVAAAPELSGSALVSTSLVLVLAGAVSKSALVPLHFWLPGAMAAPTPVSAYLHAAAMVKAGVYLVARLAPGYAGETAWQAIVITLGLATLLVGGWRALRQHDIKLVLAYGTVSQLGLMVLVVGFGTPAAALAGLALVVGHALFKSALFLIVGAIDHGTGTRDLRGLSGLWRSNPWLFGAACLSAASMAGFPPLLGFVAKESVLGALLELPDDAGFSSAGAAGLVVVVVLGSVLTFAYSARFVWGAFATKPGVAATPSHATPFWMAAPVLLLTACSVALGLVPGLMAPALEHYAESLATPGHEAHVEHLALWHGFTPALGLSAIVIVLGILLFVARKPIEKAQAKVEFPLAADRAYQACLAGTDRVASWVTGTVQRGQLSYYVLVIVAVAMVAPLAAGVVLDISWPSGDQIVWADSLVQVFIGACMIAGAVGALRANKRFMAVLMVSVTGYGMAAIFAFQGAPDLAVTQLLVETASLIAIVLALRVLPSRMDGKREPGSRKQVKRGNRLVRAIISIGFALVVVAVAAVAMSARTADPISLSMPDLAYLGGHGKNIINVTLVDLRGWDTFGEITVLAAAATGVASLIFVTGRGDRVPGRRDIPVGSVDRSLNRGTRHRIAKVFASVAEDEPRNNWLVAGKTLAPERRSIIVEVITRLMFHTLMLVSVYLLLTGHNTPGGGFSGGLVAGLALALRYLAGGRVELFEAIRIGPGTLMGTGLGIAALTVVAPVFFGGHVFQSAHVDFWFFGWHTFVTGTAFDIGVYLVVLGLVLDVLTSLGAEIDHRRDVVVADIAPVTGAVPVVAAKSAAKPAPAGPDEPPTAPTPPSGTDTTTRSGEEEK
ncbi:MAG: Na+/H+ antiporter subunit A [Galactobacter sp.]